MFIISLTYKVSLTTVDQHLDAHIAYLNKQYELGNFQVSGRKVPRTGGIILSTLTDKETLMNALAKDPFSIHEIADYEVIEFVPSKTSEEFAFLKNDI